MTKQIARGLALVSAGAFTLAANVHAALPTGVEDAIEAAQADGLTAVGLIVGMIASVLVVYALLRRIIK